MQRRLSLALLLLISAGCSPEKPATVSTEPTPKDLPPRAKVDSFTVDPDTIKKGDSAKLTWKTTNAKSIRLTDSSGKAVGGVDAASTSGEVLVKPVESTTYLLVGDSEGGNDYGLVQVRVKADEVIIPPAPTTPLTLIAAPQHIRSGEEATLFWIAPEPISIVDDQGNTIDTGAALSGSVEVRPSVTTTYTAKLGTRTANIKIKVQALISSFTSNPNGGPVGSKARLSWTTAGATDVSLSESSRGLIYTADAASIAAGFFEDTIPQVPRGTPLTYVLTVKNAEGTITAQREFLVANAPSITKFAGPLNVTKGGAPLTLTWTTVAAQSVGISATPAGGATTVAFRTADPAETASGSVEVPAPLKDTSYVLTATSASGAVSTKSLTTKVVDAPAIATFVATPGTVAQPGTKAVLTWTASSVVSATITDNFGRVLLTEIDPVKAANGTLDATPAQDATYNLKVTNAAGATAEKSVTVTVTNPLAFSVVPSLIAAGESAAITWDFTTQGATLVVVPGASSKVTGQFVDISADPTATELTFTDKDYGVVPFDFPPGFAYPYFNASYTKAYVAVDGYLSFNAISNGSSSSSGQVMPSTTSPNNVVALFWDDMLFTANTHVYWALTGTAPTRRLIIQYSNVNRYGSSTNLPTQGLLTGEIVLVENGLAEVHFQSFADSTGSGSKFNGSIGLENSTGTEGILVGGAKRTGATLPVAGDGYVFFGDTTGKGTFTVKPTASTTYTLAVTTPQGVFDVRNRLTVLNPGDLEITEVMFDSTTASPTDGQWIEIYNRTSDPVDLKDFVLTVTPTLANPSSFTVNTSLLVPAQGFVVIGSSSDQQRNGGVKVNLEWNGVTLTKADTIKLNLRTTTLSTLTYDASKFTSTAGIAVSRDPAAVTAGGSFLCQASVAFGTQKGSPGRQNGVCAGGYVVTAIPLNWEDISTTGTSVTSLGAITLPAGTAFTYFGKTFTALTFTPNGYLAFDPGTSSAYVPAMPAAAQPNGVIAPFWEDIYGSSSVNLPKQYVQFIDPDNNPATRDGYVVAMWVHQDFLGNTPDADLNFEAKVFQDGKVEFQYLKMTPGAALLNRALGSKTFVGVESPAGDVAFLYGNKQPVIKENSGILFTPVP